MKLKCVYTVVGVCMLIKTIFVIETSALNCYKCNVCGPTNETLTEIECEHPEDTCVKLQFGAYVMKRCIVSKLCSLAAVQKGWLSLLNKFKETLNLNTSEVHYDYISCCSTKLCNAGHSIKYHQSLPVVIGLGASFHFIYMRNI